MSTDLQHHIDQLRIWDVHEHTRKEALWSGPEAPDLVEALFGNYTPGDLAAAGCPLDAVAALKRHGDDLEARLAAVRPFLDAIRYTGYGEAFATLLDVCGLRTFSAAELGAAQARLRAWQQPGERLRLLRDEAGLDHVQVDDGLRTCWPDASGPEFFLYDLSWLELSCGQVPVDVLAEETGVTVADLATLRRAIAEVFARHGQRAVAVKCNMAYRRTLRWQERADADAAAALARVLAGTDDADARLCLGDWALARGVEAAVEADLPVKIHVGYLAGSFRIPDLDRLRPAHLSALLLRYPAARFVLMHTGHPYGGEILALAKHFPNVWLELSWAWSCDPVATRAFVRRFLHSVPCNKLFAFGGDTGWPTSTWAYARQARRWLTLALQDEVDEGFVTPAQARGLAGAFLVDNPAACFDVERARAGNRAALAVAS